MGRKLERDAIANPAQNGAQHMPSDLPVMPDLLHEFVQPDTRGLKCLVEDVETGCTHGVLPRCRSFTRSARNRVPGYPARKGFQVPYPGLRGWAWGAFLRLGSCLAGARPPRNR